MVARLGLERLEERLVPAALHLPSLLGVMRPDSGGAAVVTLDSLGDGVFGPGDAVFRFGLAGDQFLVGDWSGGGNDHLGVVRPNADGTAVVSLDSNGDNRFGPGDAVFTYGLAGDKFISGDWTGGGTAKVGVVRPQADGSALVVLDVNNDHQFDATNKVFTFGRATDRFLVGDWNGDGRAKIGVVRANPDGTAQVILDTNGDGVFDAGDQVFNFGLASDTFIVGDWNGDGRSKIGVVRDDGTGAAVLSLDTKGNGVFDSSDQVLHFGLASDTFLVGRWQYTGPGRTGAVNALTPADVAPIKEAAVQLWAAAGLDLARQNFLRNNTSVTIRQLGYSGSYGLLGYGGDTSSNNTLVAGSIQLDTTAQGGGWFIDPTPLRNVEYQKTSGGTYQADPKTSPAAANHVDLLTVLAHEMGRVLGVFGDSPDPTDVMYGGPLRPGTRLLPRASDVDLILHHRFPDQPGNPLTAPLQV